MEVGRRGATNRRLILIDWLSHFNWSPRDPAVVTWQTYALKWDREIYSLWKTKRKEQNHRRRRKERGRKNKNNKKKAKKERTRASEKIQTHTGRLRRATTTEINQQLIRAGAILRLAALKAAASRLWRRSDSRLSAHRHASSSSCAPFSTPRCHLPMSFAAVTQS